MSVISDVRTVLINRIGALLSVHKVYGYENPKPDGYPAVFITASAMEGEFVSNVENRRTFTFDVTVIYPTGQNLPKDGSLNPVQEAEDVLYTVFDEITSDIDQNAFSASFATIGDTDSTYQFAEASDAEWGFFETEGGMARALKIPLKIVVDFAARSS